MKFAAAPRAPRHFEPARASTRGSTTVAGPMFDLATLAPRVILTRAWIWMESNGWYVMGALALWFAVIWPSVVAPALRAARSTAHAPSAAKVRDYEEGMRAARERQEAAAKRAQEAHAEHERERRARQAEELRELGLRRRGGGRKLGSASDDDRASPAAPKPKPKPKGDGADDPFRRLRDRNPLGPDSSRGYQPPRRKVNAGG